MKTLASSRRRERLLVLGAAVALIYFGGILYIKLRPHETMVHAATRTYDHILSSDPDELYELVMPAELEKTGMTRAQFESMMNWVTQCYRGLSPAGTRLDQEYLDGVGLVSTLDMKDGEGRSSSMTIPFIKTPDGPRFYCGFLVCSALVAKYGDRYNHLPEQARYWCAVRDGLGLERQNLRRFGRGVCQTMPGDSYLMSWSDLQARAEKLADKFCAEAATPIGSP